MTARGALIAVVEDDPKIAQVLLDYLSDAGFESWALHDGTDAVAQILERQPALVLLDLMLPGKDGLTICKEVRQQSEVPIMMVTAKVDDIDRLLGLELGADDYVCKPFMPREVIARIKAILRRVQQGGSQQPDGSLHYQGITLHLDRFVCELQGQLVDCTPVEFRMLKALLVRPGRVYSREQLMLQCYTDDRIVSDRTIDTHIKNLRKKLAGNGLEADLIHSIYGVGYKLE